MSNNPILNQFCERHPLLNTLKNSIGEAAEIVINCYSGGGKLLVCGNGGSSSDSDHIVGELMKSFELKRPIEKDIAEKLTEVSAERGNYLAQKLESGLAAISLSSQTALTTAICNDIDANLVFAQQVIGYGCDKDVLIAISTSGNSQNVVDACITAKAMNLKVIGLTGMTGGKMKQYCDILLNVPEKRTAYVQELHLPVLHALCLQIENHFFSDHK
ncbi:MAG TPA: SIS domain-containing protein [Bacteroidales bacterium]|nr:SIS domain-containing protein [Bacteroidales bacterium]